MPDLTSFQFHTPGSTASASAGRQAMVTVGVALYQRMMGVWPVPIALYHLSGCVNSAPCRPTERFGSGGPPSAQGLETCFKAFGVCFDSKAAVMPLLLTILPYGILV